LFYKYRISMLSFAEENYLKAIYHLSNDGDQEVSTNAIAESLSTKPASVSDMIAKLAKKGVVNYKKYHGVRISEEGRKAALQVLRKHRLWEVFLVEKLKFNWDEVHEVAEQLEHINSSLLTKRLDEFLGYPKYDPHGDPIPDENGRFHAKPQVPLSELSEYGSGIVVAVKDSTPVFLQYLDKLGTYIGAKVKIVERIPFDGSLQLLVDNQKTIFISKEAAQNILVTE
jgi:DtxR family transcriptional regulator, Mn-dependent transcriptional regulator